MMKKPYEPSATLKKYQVMLDREADYKALQKKCNALEERIINKDNKIQQLKEKLQEKQHPNVRLVPMNDKVSEIISQYKTGRPPSLYPDEHTLQRIADMAMLCATEQEMAGVLGVSQSVFVEFKKNNPEVSQLIESANNEGKLSLRRNQFRLAENNTQMSIFLGKQYLAQSEKSSSELSLSTNVLKSLMELSDQDEEEYIDGHATIVETKSSKVLKPLSIEDNDEDDQPDVDEEN